MQSSFQLTEPVEVAFEKDLRWLLVGMLFALVIAEIAIQTARFVAKVRSYKPFDHGKGWDVWAMVTHLLLVTTVVTTSWVGWSTSIGGPMHNELRTVVSWPYVLLLLDIALLICYFVMARAVTIPDSSEQWISTPSAREDSFLLMIIFFGYVLWGIVDHWLLQGMREFERHVSFSGVWFVLAVVMWLLLKNVKKAKSVVFANLCMLVLVLSYRILRAVPIPYLTH